MSVVDDPSAASPGWYPDPADATRLRRWDGRQWTQDVVPDPAQSVPVPVAPEPVVPLYDEPEPVAAIPKEQAPAAPLYHEPEPSAPIYHEPEPAAPIYHDAPAQGGGAHAASAPASQPPQGQPVPASPAPTSAPPTPVQPTSAPPSSVPPSPAPPLTEPSVATTPAAPTTPRPSPPLNQGHAAQSGPVSLPEWATLPGLTLPPDLSSLPGMGSDSVLRTPTFEDEHPRELPTLPVFAEPFTPQSPEQAAAQSPSTPAPPVEPAPSEPIEQIAMPLTPAVPSTPYAPPPVGAQYDVPPPPGMAHVPSSGPVLPPSAFVAPTLPTSGWPTLPPVGSVQPAPVPVVSTETDSQPRIPPAPLVRDAAPSTASVWIWLIAVLPLLQFAAIYVVFHVLNVTFAPGMQWGILAAPAVFSLVFAGLDRRKLAALDVAAPSILFALIPPLYLIVRCVTVGRSAVLPLVVWFVLQAAAVAAVYLLMSSVLAVALAAQ